MKEKIIYRGPGILSLLGLIFIVLKLTGQITWSWWWVLAPFWAPLAIGIVAMSIIVILLCIFTNS